MFITKEQVKVMTGADVDNTMLAQAQTMIEAYVGKIEAEVDDAGDFERLARATAFQAAYIGASGNLLLEQAAVKSIVANESTTVFDLDMLAPYMAPFAVITCRRLSWFGSRSISVGAVFNVPGAVGSWETA